MPQPIITRLGSFLATGAGSPVVGARGDHLFIATVNGAGSVSATVPIYGSNDLQGGWVLLGTATPGGTGGGAASVAVSSSFAYWRADVNTLTAGASVSVVCSTEESTPTSGVTIVTRDTLVAMAVASSLVKGATYLTTDGSFVFAKNEMFADSYDWYTDGRRVAVGGRLTEVDLMSVPTLPLGPNGQLEIFHRTEFTDSARNKRFFCRLGGVLGSTADTISLFDRVLSTSGWQDSEVLTTIQNRGNSAVQHTRAVGTTAAGIGSSISRNLAVPLTGSKLVRLSGLTVKSGTNVTISGLAKAGGYATGTVLAGTFTGLPLVRTAVVSGAAQPEYNADPVQIELLGNADPLLCTQFRYAIADQGTGSASGGAPAVQLYDDLATASFSVRIRQGII